ncbi:MAG TPA: PLP-dependent aminotransferase family protein [Acidimicrobiales bacterium]|nr:PLP-dependent aminotransferase family protein [Acidimicrobiales bacterium]
MSKPISDLYSEKAKSAPGPYFPRPSVPVKFNFDQGSPAPETYPVDDFAEYAKRVILQAGPGGCDYVATGMDEMTRGYTGLREQLAARISRRDGREVGPDGLMLVNGSSHGLALIAAAFLNPGDGAVVEALSFPYMVGYMASAGANIATVPLDGDGMDVDAVETRLKEFAAAGVRPKMVYTIPTFQVPTGTVLSLDRRRRLVELAREWDVIVVEDNCYYEKYFDEPPPPTLFSLDESGLVIQSDSFSKMLAPSLRLGYVAGTPDALKALDGVRQDLGVNQIIPRMVEAYIADGKLDPHLARARVINRRKRDIALDALRRYCEPWVRFRVPGGGIYFWLELSPQVDWEQVRERAVADGVACRPGERFTGDDSGKGFLRLSFLHVSEEEIERGIGVLGKALSASVIA